MFPMSISGQPDATARPRVLIAGIGSCHGDDRFGWVVAQRLQLECDAAVATVRLARSPSDLLCWLDDRPFVQLILCDACRGLGPVGTICRLDWPAAEIQHVDWSNTHDLPLPGTLQIAQTLGRLPPHVTLWLVQAGSRCQANHRQAEGLTVEVSQAVPQVVQRILDSM